MSFQRESEVTVIGRRLLVSWENQENRCESTKAFFHVGGVRSERRNFFFDFHSENVRITEIFSPFILTFFAPFSSASAQTFLTFSPFSFHL